MNKLKLFPNNNIIIKYKNVDLYELKLNIYFIF